jgi:tetratricopeptide (TPR) repeat protein
MDKSREEKVEEIFTSGVDHLEKGRLKDAIAAFEEVITLNDTDAAAHFNLGVACMRVVRADVEQDFYLEDHTDEEAWILRAIAEFNRVLELEPDNEEAKKNIDALNKLMDMGV